MSTLTVNTFAKGPARLRATTSLLSERYVRGREVGHHDAEWLQRPNVAPVPLATLTLFFMYR